MVSGEAFSRRFARIGIGFIFIALALWSILWGIADFFYRQGERVVVSWSAQDKLPAISEIGAARGAIARSVALNPFEGRYRAALVRTDEWEAIASGPWTIEGRERQENALGLYAAAALLRPSDSAIWSQIAALSAGSGRLDESVFTALDRAFIYGPHRWPSLKKALVTGAVLWELAPSDTRRLYEKSLEGILAHDSHYSLFVIETMVALRRESILDHFHLSEKLRLRLDGYLKARTEATGKRRE